MARPVSTSVPRRWPWALAALVAAAVLVIVLITKQDVAGPGKAAPFDTPTTAPASPSGAASGCLGGSSDLGTVILRAQKEAPLTGDGAAAFLATLIRWMGEARRQPAILDTVGPKIWADALPQSEIEAMRSKNHQDIEAGLADTTVTFKDSYYRVISATPTEAIIEFSVRSTRVGRPEEVASAVLRTTAQDGQWRFAGGDVARTAALAGDDNGESARADLAATGVAFVGAC